MTIGEVAKQSGVAASAIRYYERCGILPRTVRSGGRRVYSGAVLERLAVVERAKACGFTLGETRQLFFGFRADAPPSERWRSLAQRKLQELAELERKIAGMRELLDRSCECRNLEECGRRILAKRRG